MPRTANTNTGEVKSAKNQLGLTPDAEVQAILSKVPKGGVNKFVNAAIKSFAEDKKEDLDAMAKLAAKLHMS